MNSNGTAARNRSVPSLFLPGRLMPPALLAAKKVSINPRSTIPQKRTASKAEENSGVIASQDMRLVLCNQDSASIGVLATTRVGVPPPDLAKSNHKIGLAGREGSEPRRSSGSS